MDRLRRPFELEVAESTEGSEHAKEAIAADDLAHRLVRVLLGDTLDL